MSTDSSVLKAVENLIDYGYHDEKKDYDCMKPELRDGHIFESYEVLNEWASKVKTDEAIRDKNIISAQTWQSHPEFYREIFASL